MQNFIESLGKKKSVNSHTKPAKKVPEHVGVIDNCESITDIHDKSEISATSLILTLLAAAANLLPLPRQVMCCSRNSGLVTVVLALAFASADLCLEK